MKKNKDSDFVKRTLNRTKRQFEAYDEVEALTKAFERYHEAKAGFRKALIWLTVLHAAFFFVSALLNDATFITIGSIATFASLLMMNLLAATW